jgi:hypothetical protein
MPTPEVRRFRCDTEVGGEQEGEDPTVNLLQKTAEAAAVDGCRHRDVPALRQRARRPR